MATQEPGRATAVGALTSLPRLEDLPVVDQGYEPDRVREAFDAYRRHTLQLQAQLRVLQAAGGTARVEPTGHAVRMDALHLIRAAAEFADQLERDAQNASAVQLSRAEEEIRRRHREAQTRESEIERYRRDSERQRSEILNAARGEARELVAKANQDATRELQEAEARGARLLEQSRHQATELTNAARAEVEQTLEWARAQAGAVVTRAQQGAEQLLGAAGLPAEDMGRVVDAIIRSAEAAEAARPGFKPVAVGEPPRPVPPAEEPQDAEPAGEEAGADEPQAEAVPAGASDERASSPGQDEGPDESGGER